MKRFWLIAAFLLLAAPWAMADAGVLKATNVPEERAMSVLKLRKMVVYITVEEQHANVRVLQVFENLTDQELEGKYAFRIPEGAAVSDFAIWEDNVRIPGVILERRKARRIYEQLTASKIDPGILEKGEAEEERNAFITRVYPIPARGTKRIEISYEEPLEVTSLRSRFAFPLKPEIYEEQAAEEFEVKFTLSSAVPVEDFQIKMKGAEFTKGADDDGVHKISRSLQARNITFTDDLAFTWKLKATGGQFDFYTYRDVKRQTLDIGPGGGQTYRDDTGYFLGRATFGALPAAGGEASAPPRDIIFALDNSLSMQGRKLEAAFNTLSDFLGRLGAADRFSLILFNDQVSVFERKPVEATRAQVDRALAFVRGQALTGGTDLLGALEGAKSALGKPESGRAQLVLLITDGNPTAKAISYKKIEEQWKKSDGGRTRLFIFGIGNDANAELLGPLAQSSDGFFTWAEETEDLEFKLTTFFEKVGAPSIGSIRLEYSNPANFTQVYPADPQKTFAGGAVEFVGKYLKPAKGVEIAAVGQGVRMAKTTDLPESDTSKPWIRRVWAKARVAYLLHLIRFEGEKDEWVEEIIALAKEYKFVTPYTSFLAAPRSLLRPRVIKPGDPILRVRTDPAIESVTAIFPFGLIKEMRRVERDATAGDVWETRFLAPKWMADGVYNCTLVLFDSAGRGYREEKQFIIDSRPPQLNVKLLTEVARVGAAMEIRVDADPDTRWIRAALPGLPAVEIRWNPELKVSQGAIPVPPDFPPGRYEITVSAEDFAHNSASRIIPIFVTGGGQ